MSHYLLSINQDTNHTTVTLFDHRGKALCDTQTNIKQLQVADNWIEYCPEAIWQSVLTCCKKTLYKSNTTAKDITAIGISNQRETTIIWNRKTGDVIANAIAWQDRRTADICQHLINDNLQIIVREKTGLLLDPYFSATKVAWLLDNTPGARHLAEKGELAFGTVDSYLLWRLSGGKSHFTDATNASRTLLFNIHGQHWDKDLLQLFNIPESILPEVLDSSAKFGLTDPQLFGGEIPITAMIGDQQAAALGQACHKPGMMKSSYGIGCFTLFNTGENVIESTHRILSTVAYRLNDKVSYAAEGSIFAISETAKWVREALELVNKQPLQPDFSDESLDSSGVYLVPAFSGLGSPYWDPLARGVITGLTSHSKFEHIIRSALEAVCYQTRDLIEAMVSDGITLPETLRVDGSLVINRWLMQFLSNILNMPIEVSSLSEASSLGAAFLAGLQQGVYQSLDELNDLWEKRDVFQPNIEDSSREALYNEWKKAWGFINL